MNMTKGALILSLSFLLAACSSIPQNIKGNNQPDIQKSFVAVHNQPGLYYRWIAMRSLILKPTIRVDCSPDKAASLIQ